jgi:DNA-binding IscR family transcriptional regulator
MRDTPAFRGKKSRFTHHASRFNFLIPLKNVGSSCFFNFFLDNETICNYNCYEIKKERKKMNTSSRFIVATQILSLLSLFKEEAATSALLAWSVNTNPVVIRRILGMLRTAGLIHSQTGPKGGTWLLKKPEELTLMEIYDALEEGELFHMHYSEPNSDCPIGHLIQDSLSGIMADAKNALRNSLDRTTLAEVVEDMTTRSGIKDAMLATGKSFPELREEYAYINGEVVRKS